MSSFDVPIEFRRIYKGPLDPSLHFTSLSALNDYLDDPTRYPGQIVSVIDSGHVYIYQLNATEDAWEQLLTGNAAVLSVNNETGNVIITPDDLDDSSTINKFITQAQIDELHSHTNKATLDNTEEAFTTDLKNQILSFSSPENIDGGTF
jgi:hypothetical protein